MNNNNNLDFVLFGLAREEPLGFQIYYPKITKILNINSNSLVSLIKLPYGVELKKNADNIILLSFFKKNDQGYICISKYKYGGIDTSRRSTFYASSIIFNVNSTLSIEFILNALNDYLDICKEVHKIGTSDKHLLQINDLEERTRKKTTPIESSIWSEIKFVKGISFISSSLKDLEEIEYVKYLLSKNFHLPTKVFIANNKSLLEDVGGPKFSFELDNESSEIVLLNNFGQKVKINTPNPNVQSDSQNRSNKDLGTVSDEKSNVSDDLSDKDKNNTNIQNSDDNNGEEKSSDEKSNISEDLSDKDNSNTDVQNSVDNNGEEKKI